MKQFAVMPLDDYKGLCDLLRESGSSGDKKYKSGEIRGVVADRMQNAFSAGQGSGHDIGYEEGYKKGYGDGVNSVPSGDNFYDTFWDNFQHNGNLNQYAMAFGSLSIVVSTWNENNWKPKYDFMLSGNNNQMFQCANIGVDMVEKLKTLGLTFDTRSATQINQMFKGSAFTHLGELDFTNVTRQTWAFGEVFRGMARLVTIDKIKSDTAISGFSNLFNECTALVNITFDCIIENSISFLWSPLSVESMKNIILHLQNYAGTDKELAYTVSFNDVCWEALETDSTAPDGGTWRNYVDNLGWLT